MTATYEPLTTSRATRPPLATVTPVAPVAPDRVAARRAALTALDSFVRPLLAEHLRLPFSLVPPTVELTIYDEVYRRTSAGGHWTLSTRWTGLLTHTISGYTVTLHFDAEDRPSRFLISGARDIWTDDATPEALARGLAEAARGGPLVTWAPNLPPGISL